jgi:predicted S18 family serine protease
LAIATATPVPPTSTATPSTSPTASNGTPIGQYVLFGGTVVVLLAAIALAVRRRR